MPRALFIGRFQPFHRGHYHAVKTLQRDYDLVVGIGSAQKSHEPENPLIFEERKTIVQHCFPDLEIVRLDDRDDDDDWMDHIEDTITFDLGVSGNDHVRRIFEGRGVPIQHPDYRDPERFSGTRIRDKIRAGEKWSHLVPDCSRTKLAAYDFAARVKNSSQ